MVEDSPTVRHATRTMLEQLGYGVLTAADDQEALQVYNQHHEEIALVLADVVMPEMGGLSLIQALRRRAPDVPVVAMTGYPLEQDARNLPDHEDIERVQKPVSGAQLARAVRRALENR